jgi:alpha-beta hydrolase superfamily lysophospholipase
MVLVHGLIEHSGRYADVAGQLNRHGCAVYAIDLRGHGKSDGDRVWVRRFEHFVNDVELLVRRVADQHPGKPLFLLGHSMGGAIVALASLTRKPKVRGLVFSAPALKIGPRVYPILRHVAQVAGRLFPRVRVIKMTGNSISRDPHVVADFQQDPLVFHERLPNRTAAEILKAAHWLSAHLGSVEQPFLVMHGTGDCVTDPEGSRLLYERASSNDKEIKLYDGLYHDLWHEPEGNRVMADLIAWLAARQNSTTDAAKPRK